MNLLSSGATLKIVAETRAVLRRRTERPPLFTSSPLHSLFWSSRMAAVRPWAAADALRSVSLEQLQSTNVGGILVQDLAAFSVSLLGSYVWVKLFGVLSDRDILEQKLSRKLIHITTGPLFLMTWFLYSSAPEAQYLAALVPLLNVIRIGANGLGILRERSFVKSMSRAGGMSELLSGPMFYAITLFVATAFFWRSSVTSYAVVGILTGGDGMADIIGRRFGKHRIPYNKSKSIEGSIALTVFGFLMTAGLMAFFASVHMLHVVGSIRSICIQLLLVSLVCAFVESLALTEKVDDNLAVPLTAVLLSSFLQSQV